MEFSVIGLRLYKILITKQFNILRMSNGTNYFLSFSINII